MAEFITRAQNLGIGWIIALLVLVIVVVLAVIGQALTPLLVLALIGALAVARLI